MSAKRNERPISIQAYTEVTGPDGETGFVFTLDAVQDPRYREQVPLALRRKADAILAMRDASGTAALPVVSRCRHPKRTDTHRRYVAWRAEGYTNIAQYHGRVTPSAGAAIRVSVVSELHDDGRFRTYGHSQGLTVVPLASISAEADDYAQVVATAAAARPKP